MKYISTLTISFECTGKNAKDVAHALATYFKSHSKDFGFISFDPESKLKKKVKVTITKKETKSCKQLS